MVPFKPWKWGENDRARWAEGRSQLLLAGPTCGVLGRHKAGLRGYGSLVPTLLAIGTMGRAANT